MAQQSKPDINTVWASAGDTGTPPVEFDINEGWLAEKPPFQEMNWLQNRFNQFMKHMNEFGIAEWDTDTNYALNALVIHLGVHYTSDSTDNTGNTPTVSGWSLVDFQPGMPVGAIIDWTGDFNNPPVGWGVCDGTSGTPDLRGLFIRGADDGTSFAVGSTGGSIIKTTDTSLSHDHDSITQPDGGHFHNVTIDDHTLAESEMPSHSHNTQLDVIAGQRPQLQGLSTEGHVHANGSYNTDSTGGSSGHNHTGSTVSVPHHVHTLNDEPGHNHEIVDARPPFYTLVKLIKL